MQPFPSTVTCRKPKAVRKVNLTYCLCGKQDDGKLMIECDVCGHCGEWFHVFLLDFVTFVWYYHFLDTSAVILCVLLCLTYFSIFVRYNYSIWFLNGRKVYSAFLDASKAFDKVLHNGLYKKLLDKKESSVVFCAMAD